MGSNGTTLVNSVDDVLTAAPRVCRHVEQDRDEVVITVGGRGYCEYCYDIMLEARYDR